MGLSSSKSVVTQINNNTSNKSSNKNDKYNNKSVTTPKSASIAFHRQRQIVNDPNKTKLTNRQLVEHRYLKHQQIKQNNNQINLQQYHQQLQEQELAKSAPTTRKVDFIPIVNNKFQLTPKSHQRKVHYEEPSALTISDCESMNNTFNDKRARKSLFDFRSEVHSGKTASSSSDIKSKDNKEKDRLRIMPKTNNSNEDDNPRPRENRSHKRTALYSENLPTFYVGSGNNSELIISIMKRLGWEQVFEKNEDTFKFKWVQSVRSVNWNTFKEGEQIVNHIPNCSLFTNKLNLLCSLQAYEKTQASVQNKPSHFLPLEEYVPLTFKLDDKMDRETFFNTAKDEELWICKPVSLNQGKGIYLVRSPDVLKQKLDQFDEGQSKKFGLNKPINRIIQKYITNPLTINKRKFDIRCYMLIASTKPLLVLFHHGYLRLSMYEFQNDDNNLVTHLTNQYFQKKDPKYNEIKEDTTWSMDQFNDYINRQIAPKKNLPKDWVLNDLTKKMHQIMLQVIHSVRHKLKRKIGYFGLYGYDFMIDEDMKVWLIEINVNPAITTNTDVLVNAIPPAVDEGIQIALECFDKSKQNKKLLPLNTMKGYMVIYNETTSPFPKPNLERSPSFQKRSISSSPVNQHRQSLPKPNESANIYQANSKTKREEDQSNRLPVKSSEFRSKKLTDNQTAKGLDRIKEETSKKQQSAEDPSTSSKYKMRYSSARSRIAQQSAGAIELKPATVEVFFRNSTNKNDSNSTKITIERIERKPLPTTVFPPPRIGLKS